MVVDIGNYSDVVGDGGAGDWGKISANDFGDAGRSGGGSVFESVGMGNAVVPELVFGSAGEECDGPDSAGDVDGNPSSVELVRARREFRVVDEIGTDMFGIGLVGRGDGSGLFGASD